MVYFDGAGGRVHYRRWSAEQPRAVVVLLHGLRQQSADYHRFARAANGHGIAVFGIDHLGHGLSEGEWNAQAPADHLVANVLHLVGVARAAYPGVPLVLAGHSLGAGTALVAMASGAEAVGEVSAVVLTGTPQQVLDMGVAPPPVPTLALHGTEDRIAPIEPVRAWAAGTRCVVREFAGAGHDLLHEPDHRLVTRAVLDFVLAAGNASEDERRRPAGISLRLGEQLAQARPVRLIQR
ncbi:alpha/beta hydrolase [Nocardia wallacei]|uniref:alpha/beta hydrolase n=1 Tax=Nocardia wallacei TaxID=480035 RepID=UPI00245848F2|nr:alpha/beta fold hydrolase [Nocardia wallacei]